MTPEKIEKLSQTRHTFTFMVMCSIHLHTDTNIAAFIAHYREAFPDACVLPKMHMMENHIVPFLKQWGVGLGSKVQKVFMPPSME